MSAGRWNKMLKIILLGHPTIMGYLRLGKYWLYSCGQSFAKQKINLNFRFKLSHITVFFKCIMAIIIRNQSIWCTIFFQERKTCKEKTGLPLRVQSLKLTAGIQQNSMSFQRTWNWNCWFLRLLRFLIYKSTGILEIGHVENNAIYGKALGSMVSFWSQKERRLFPLFRSKLICSALFCLGISRYYFCCCCCFFELLQVVDKQVSEYFLYLSGRQFVHSIHNLGEGNYLAK